MGEFLRTCGVYVPTEDGRQCAIEFVRRRPNFWSIDVSDELIRQAPEGLTAALGMAIIEMREQLLTGDLNDGDDCAACGQYLGDHEDSDAGPQTVCPAQYDGPESDWAEQFKADRAAFKPGPTDAHIDGGESDA